jgi:hypothetical protein
MPLVRASCGDGRPALPRLVTFSLVTLLLLQVDAHKIQDERHGHMARIQSFAVRVVVLRASITLLLPSGRRFSARHGDAL